MPEVNLLLDDTPVQINLATAPEAVMSAAALAQLALKVDKSSYFAQRLGATATQDEFDDMVAAMTASRSGPQIGTNYLTEAENGYRIEPGLYTGLTAGLTKNSGKFGLVAPTLGSVVIVVPDDEYLLEHLNTSIGVHLENLIVLGGKGLYRSTGTGNNVQGNHLFRNLHIIDYDECGIQNEANDHPNLIVENTILRGKQGERTMGIAWGGLLDDMHLNGVAFQRDAINLKLGGGDGNISGRFTVENGSFIGFGGTTLETSVWIVPNTSGGTNSGHGGLFKRLKFGNENLTAGAPRVLIAPEDPADIAAGNPRGAIFPHYVWDSDESTNVVTGLIFENNDWIAGSPHGAPIIRSYVPSFRELDWDESNQYNGGNYDRLCEFMGERDPYYTRHNWNIGINPTGSGGIKEAPFLKGLVGHLVGADMVELTGIGTVTDKAGLMQSIEGVTPCAPVRHDHGYGKIKNARVAADFTAVGSVTVTPSADQYGKVNGKQQVTFAAMSTANNHILYASLPAMTGMKRAWVQVRGLEQDAATSLKVIRVSLYNGSTGSPVDQKDILLPPPGAPLDVPFPLTTPTGGAAVHRLRFQAIDYEGGVSESFVFEGVYLNYGKEPAPIGHIHMPLGMFPWDGPHIVDDETGEHQWQTSARKWRWKASAPTSETDGAALIDETMLPVVIEEWVSDGTTGTKTFSSLGSYRDLRIEILGRSQQAVAAASLFFRFNGDTAGNYDHTRGGVSGDAAATPTTDRAQTQGLLGFIPGASAAADLFGICRAEAMLYRGALHEKGMRSVSTYKTGTAADTELHQFTATSWWRNKAAITSLTVLLSAGNNFVTGTTIRLIGLN